MKKLLIVFIIAELIWCAIGITQMTRGWFILGAFNFLTGLVLIFFSLHTLKKWKS